MRNTALIIITILNYIIIGCGQGTVNRLEKNIEDFTVKKIDFKYHHSIEFHQKMAFNLIQLTNDYKIPKMHDEEWAVDYNNKAFDIIEEIELDESISYSMIYIYGVKNKRNEAWAPYWSIVLIGEGDKIIDLINYIP